MSRYRYTPIVWPRSVRFIGFPRMVLHFAKADYFRDFRISFSEGNREGSSLWVISVKPVENVGCS